MNLPSKPAIAFLGLGKMGQPMAARLLAAGHSLSVWNRSAQKAQLLVAQGARHAESVEDAMSGAELTFLMLSDGPTVSEVLFERHADSAIRPGAIVVDMSSIPPALAAGHARLLQTRGVHHLDAPVSGGTTGARDGTLAIMVGGKAEAFETARPILTVMGRATLIGPAGAGQLAKLANQAIVAASIAAVGEALLLAAAGGADPSKVREALMGGFADSAILRLHGERMLKRAWIPGGRVRTQVKDLRTLLEVASGMALELPLSSKVAELFEASLAAGLGGYDHSALLLELERRNPGRRVGAEPDQIPAEDR